MGIQHHNLFLLHRPASEQEDHNNAYGSDHGSYAGDYDYGEGDSIRHGAEEEEVDFGVVAKLIIQPGFNTFTFRGLRPFTKIGQLAGRAVRVSEGIFFLLVVISWRLMGKV